MCTRVLLLSHKPKFKHFDKECSDLKPILLGEADIGRLVDRLSLESEDQGAERPFTDRELAFGQIARNCAMNSPNQKENSWRHKLNSPSDFM